MATLSFRKVLFLGAVISVGIVRCSSDEAAECRVIVPLFDDACPADSELALDAPECLRDGQIVSESDGQPALCAIAQSCTWKCRLPCSCGVEMASRATFSCTPDCDGPPSLLELMLSAGEVNEALEPDRTDYTATVLFWYPPFAFGPQP